MLLPKALFCAFVIVAVSFAADTPEKAILETVFATKSETVLKHLPPAVKEMIDRLPEKERTAALATFLPHKWLGGKPQPANNGTDLLRFENPHVPADPLYIRIQRQVSSGLEAVLQIAVCQQQCHNSMLIWMRMEEGEWRFVEVQSGGHSVAQFDNLDFVEHLRSSVEYEGREQTAVANLRTLNTALVTYLSTYEAFPKSLKPLSGVYSEEAEPTAEQSLLVDEQFMAEPCVVAGYLFEYRWMNTDDGEGYVLIARPVDYGRSGKKSFYTDQSGVIRSTVEDRAAMQDDEPI
jgi:hypothetical protein